MTSLRLQSWFPGEGGAIGGGGLGAVMSDTCKRAFVAGTIRVQSKDKLSCPRNQSILLDPIPTPPQTPPPPPPHPSIGRRDRSPILWRSLTGLVFLWFIDLKEAADPTSGVVALGSHPPHPRSHSLAGRRRLWRIARTQAMAAWQELREEKPTNNSQRVGASVCSSHAMDVSIKAAAPCPFCFILPCLDQLTHLQSLRKNI